MMQTKILKEYFKSIIIGVTSAVVLWVGLSVFLLFNGKTADIYLPQYVVHSITAEIQIDDGNTWLSENAVDLLSVYNLWLQVLDNTGNVVFSYKVPDLAPSFYRPIDLVHYTQMSNRLEGQTLYLTQMDDYLIIVGSSSSLVYKLNSNITVKSATIQSLYLLVIVVAGIVIIAGQVFAKRISTPISDALNIIEEISTNKVVEIPAYQNSIFESVFIQLDMLQDKLQETQVMREQWIANISHDIKTPLSSIRGYTEILTSKDYKLTSEEISMFSEEILKSELVIEGLLEELRFHQRLMENQVILDIQQVNIVELIKECKLELDKNLKNAIRVTAPDEVICGVDVMLFNRCMQNILWNAYLHNNEDIQIDICVKLLEEDVKITIADNGQGISAYDLNNIFERYYRGEASQNTKGTGLGLAIVKEVVSTHGGKIRVESQQGVGTTFEILLLL